MQNEITKPNKKPKKKNWIHYCGFILLMLILSYPTLAQIHPTNVFSGENPVLGVEKMGTHLTPELSQISEFEKLDVVVMCKNPNIDYSASVKSNLGEVQLLRIWKYLGGFSARLTSSQIYDLATLSFVSFIDLDIKENAVCMDSARNRTDVDWLQSQYPDLDGDKDSNSTGYSKDDIVIAILDSGISDSHYDLDGGKVIGWVDLVGDDSVTSSVPTMLEKYTVPYDSSTIISGTIHTEPYDDLGHGTHCASIAAGSGDANSSYRGVASEAALVGVKIIKYDATILLSDALAAFDWVAGNKSEYGIDIVSCSWGFTPYGEYGTLAQAADTLVATYGLVVVVAAGNEGPSSDTIAQPGTGKYVITAGNAVDPDESGDGWELASDSGRGPCDDDRIKPDILAPGTNITAADYDDNDGYIKMSGTSMATAFVAGLCALWLDYDCNLSQTENNQSYVKNLLMAAATDMPEDSTPGLDSSYGAGRVDAQDEYNFLTSDISSNSLDAPIVLNYVYESSYTRYNEPLWIGDSDDGADWYKFNCEEDYFMWVSAHGDPDLILKVEIYDEDLELVASSYPGNNRNTGYWADYTGTYYGRIVVCSQSGDYYDVEILLTAS